MKNILKYLVGCIISCIGTALILVGEKTESAFTIVSKTVTMPIANYSLARARSAALVNKTVTLPIVNYSLARALRRACKQSTNHGYLLQSTYRGRWALLFGK